MNRLIDLAPKPSDALKAMLRGLEKMDSRSDFKIDMDTFGLVIKTSHIVACFGCAASCTVLELLEVKDINYALFPRVLGRAEWLDINEQELVKFELAIDAFRTGYPCPLLDFYNVKPSLIKKIALLMPFVGLTTFDWKKQIPVVEQVIALFEKHKI
jgi:hypothetical protein